MKICMPNESATRIKTPLTVADVPVGKLFRSRATGRIYVKGRRPLGGFCVAPGDSPYLSTIGEWCPDLSKDAAVEILDGHFQVERVITYRQDT